MPIKIEGQPTPFCFDDCPNIQLKMKNISMYGDNIKQVTLKRIFCEHEDACQMWADKFLKNKTEDFKHF